MPAINELRLISNDRPTADELGSIARSFGLKHVHAALTEILDTAEKENLTHSQFLMKLLTAEAFGRYEKKRLRNMSAAHFPAYGELEEYDLNELDSGLTAAQLSQLKEFNWLDAGSNVLFIGPPGVGKTMLAVGLGKKAVQAGYAVAFERMTDFIDILDNAATDKKKGCRLKNIRKCRLLIIDEVGFTPVNAAQANRFFNFISSVYLDMSLMFTSNKNVSAWREIFGDKDLTKGLLDRVLGHSRCFELSGTSYRMKHADRTV